VPKGFPTLLVPVFPWGERKDLLISLPEIVDFIHTAVEAGGRALVRPSGDFDFEVIVITCGYCKPVLFFLLQRREIKSPSSSDVDPEDLCRESGAYLERKYVDCPRESIYRAPIDRTCNRRRALLEGGADRDETP
jgi:hypothetical protein